MKVEFYNSKKRKELIEKLNSQFGVKTLVPIIFETGREKIRGFSGDLTIDEIYALNKITNIEFIGLYLFSQGLEDLRISFDGTTLFKDQFEHNVLLIDDDQLDKWIRGNSLNMSVKKGMYIIKHNDDVFGCGISDGDRIINFVPKERRIRRS